MHATLRTPRPRAISASWAALALVAALLVVPSGAPLCASAVGSCAIDAVPAPTAPARCPMGDAMGDMPDLPGMDCCVAGEAPRSPAPAVPGKADGENQLQPRPLLGLTPASADLPSTALALTAPAPAPAVDLAAPAVPLYTLLSSLLN